MQRETSFAEQNAKRFKLVCEALKQNDFEVKINIIDYLMIPIDKAINQLMKRSEILKAIKFEDCSRCSEAELKVQSSDFFLQWANGGFGQDIQTEFMNQMKADTLAALCQNSDASVVHTCFQLLVFGMSDIWRRFCLPAQSFPNRLFSVAELDVETCAKYIEEFQGTLHNCPCCIDPGFGRPMLQQAYPTEESIYEFPGLFSRHFPSIWTSAGHHHRIACFDS